ncbi:hypothetical protein [Lysobacter gummosus]
MPTPVRRSAWRSEICPALPRCRSRCCLPGPPVPGWLRPRTSHRGS